MSQSVSQDILFYIYCIIVKENLERQETNKHGKGTEWHLPTTDRRPAYGWVSLRHIEMKWNKNEYFGQITVAFLSSRIQETEAKLYVPLGRGWNMRPAVCLDWRTSWYAVSNWRWMWSGVESGSLYMTLPDQHSWKGIWWDWVWIAIGRSGFDTMVVNQCPLKAWDLKDFRDKWRWGVAKGENTTP